MKMEKKMWSTPMAAVEQFMPNESYSAMCLGIRCETGAGKGLNGSDLSLDADPRGNNRGYADEHNHEEFYFFGWQGTWHTAEDDKSGCGWAHNQYLQYEERDDGHTYYTMIEKNPNVSNQPLDCTLYNENWSSKDSDGFWVDLVQGAKVFWSTTVGSLEMFHWGYVNLLDETRPNRS